MKNRLMEGKVALVTGATSGIGFETALGLARLGAEVWLVGRDEERVEQSVRLIRERSGHDAVEGLVADLSVQAEVRSLAVALQERVKRLDVLVNNAGGWFGTREMTVDGIEKTWALNHLAYVLLTLRLMPLLKEGDAGRIVNVASHLHAYGKIHFDDLNGAQGYGSVRAYNQSKLANVCFTLALARRLRGSGVTVNALHPGAVATGMGRDMAPWMGLLNGVMRWFYVSAERGARTSVYLASSPEVEGVSGGYFVRCRKVEPGQAGREVELQEKLWQVSLEQVGEEFDNEG